MYASEVPSRWSKILEISSWVVLFIVLVPGTALAFFAENSLPNTPLYPVKRDLETVVLALTSFNNSTKSFYQLALADTRVKEAQQIFASSNAVTPQDIQQLDIVMAQLNATQQTINTVADPIQKAQMQKQLNTTASNYKKQLDTIQEHIQITITPNSPQPQTNNNSSNENTNNTNNTQSNTSNNSSSVDFSNLPEDQKTTLEQKINDITTQLDTFIPSVTPDQEQNPQETLAPVTSPTPFNRHRENGDRNNRDNSGDSSSSGR